MTGAPIRRRPERDVPGIRDLILEACAELEASAA
jgi:hypothetical protein